MFDKTLVHVNQDGLCATRRCVTEDSRKHAYNDFTVPTMPRGPKWCLHDAGMCNRKAPQLAADNAISFTSLSNFNSNTCVSKSRVALHALVEQGSCPLYCVVPFFQLKSDLLSFHEQLGPVAVLGQTYHHRNRNFDDTQSTSWATLEGGQEWNFVFPRIPGLLYIQKYFRTINE